MNNLSMDTLRTFVTIHELGSFTQAGNMLGRSQPAISLQVKRLEATLGVSLFNRSSVQLELTQAGVLLAVKARQILKLNDEIISQFIKPDLSGRLHLGLPSEFATTLLPKIVGRFAQSYPNVTLEVTSDLSRNLLSKADSKGFDLILALHDSVTGAGNGRVKVDELVWVTSHAHSAHLQDTVPLIAAPNGCIYRDRAIKTLNQIKQPWRIIYTIPDLTGIQAAIEEGLGVTVLAKSTVPDNLTVIRTCEKFPKLGKIGINLINKGNSENEAVTRLITYIKSSLI